MRGSKPFLFTNCKTGEGIPELVDLIKSEFLFDIDPRMQRFGMIPAAAAPWARAEALGASVPELAAFQDEPPQMKSGTVGKTGFLRLGFERRRRQTILANLERRAPYMVQRALYCDQRKCPVSACVFLITTTGCLLQGDRLALDITLGPRAQAHVTTQSATKIHAMDANYAAQTQTITLADDAYLEFLPDPVIPHRQRAVRQRHADLRRSIGHAAVFGDHSTRPQSIIIRTNASAPP